MPKLLFPVGDRELHYVKATDGSWSLPLYVDWKVDREVQKKYALIMPAVGLYTNQAFTLKGLFEFHDEQGREDQWLVPEAVALSVLHKAPGITPVAYYKWPDDSQPPIPGRNPLSLSFTGKDSTLEPTVGDLDAFIKYICNIHGLPNSIVKVVLRAIGESGPAWMLEERKPIDLGFCKLIAAPFRANWKQIVMAKLKNYKLTGIFRGPQNAQKAELEAAGFPETLCSLHNIGLLKVGGSSRIDYTIEAIPSSKFDKEVVKCETKRIACGQTNYVATFEKTVELTYDYLVEAMEAYVKKAAYPFAKLFQRSGTGVFRFAPAFAEDRRFLGLDLKKLPVHIVEADSNFSVFGEGRKTTLVQPKAKALPEVPIVPRGTQDMRIGNEHGQLAESNNGNAGTAGVPMLHAGESET